MKVNYRPSPKAHQPAVDNGLKVEYAPARRGGMKWRWYLLLLLVITPLLVLSWVILRPSLLVLAPGIMTTEPLEMRAHHKGLLAEVQVHPGEQVIAGQVLGRLINAELSAKIAELKRQMAQLEDISTQSNQAILDQLQQQIKVAEEGVRRQGSLVYQFENFKKQGIVPAADMAAVHQAYSNAKLVLEQARTDLLIAQQRQQQELQAGVVSQARNSLMLQLAELQARNEALTLKAPFSARVADLLVQEGEYIAEQQPLLWLSGRSQPVVVSYLDPRYLDYVRLGQTASIKLPNGTYLDGVINEPTELVGKVPAQLAGPFDGEKPALKVTLTLKPDKNVELSNVEGVPVEVSFDQFINQFITALAAE